MPRVVEQYAENKDMLNFYFTLVKKYAKFTNSKNYKKKW